VADQEVPETATPVTAAALYSAIATAWPTLIGTPFVPLAAVVLVAQSAQETGSWASVYNHNLGGQKYVAGTGEDYFWSNTTEGSGANAQHVLARFASFPSLAQGIRNWLSLIHAHYPGAWARALAGDPAGFVAQLAQGGYFTGSVAAYTARVESFFKKFLPLAHGPLAPASSGSGSGELPPALMAAGLTLAGYVAYRALEWSFGHARDHVEKVTRRRRGARRRRVPA
jgi:hypothetical protein